MGTGNVRQQRNGAASRRPRIRPQRLSRRTTVGGVTAAVAEATLRDQSPGLRWNTHAIGDDEAPLPVAGGSDARRSAAASCSLRGSPPALPGRVEERFEEEASASDRRPSTRQGWSRTGARRDASTGFTRVGVADADSADDAGSARGESDRRTNCAGRHLGGTAVSAPRPARVHPPSNLPPSERRTSATPCTHEKKPSNNAGAPSPVRRLRRARLRSPAHTTEGAHVPLSHGHAAVAMAPSAPADGVVRGGGSAAAQRERGGQGPVSAVNMQKERRPTGCNKPGQSRGGGQGTSCASRRHSLYGKHRSTPSIARPKVDVRANPADFCRITDALELRPRNFVPLRPPSLLPPLCGLREKVLRGAPARGPERWDDGVDMLPRLSEDEDTKGGGDSKEACASVNPVGQGRTASWSRDAGSRR